MTSRWLRGSFDGTCQACPQALGSVPATTSIRATSSVNDQVCGRSARPSTETPWPRRIRPTIRSPSALCAPGPTKSQARTSADPDPPGLVRGERVLPDAGADLSLAARRGQRRGLGHRMRLVVAADPQGPRRGAVAVQVGQRDQDRAAAFRGAEQAGGDRRPVGRPAMVGGVDAVVDHRGALGQAGHRRGVRGVRGHAW